MKKNRDSSYFYDSTRLVNPFWEELRGLKENLFILRRMIYTNFKTRYKRSYLGVIWSLLNPLLNMIIFVIIFSNLFRFNIPHYPLYILSGNMIFGLFSSSTSEAMVQIIANAGMIRRVYLPKTIYVLAGIGINGINLILTFIPFLAIAVVDRLPFSWTIILILPVLLLTTLFVVGMCLIVATITTFVNDFSQIWSVIITLWMYLTPLFYPIDIITPEWLKFYKLNPMYIYVTLFRDPLLYQKVPEMGLWVGGFLYGFLIFSFGWWFFTKNSNEFAYRA